MIHMLIILMTISNLWRDWIPLHLHTNMIIGNIIITIIVTAIIIVVNIQTPLRLPANDYDYDSYVDYFDEIFAETGRLCICTPSASDCKPPALHWMLRTGENQICCPPLDVEDR